MAKMNYGRLCRELILARVNFEYQTRNGHERAWQSHGAIRSISPPAVCTAVAISADTASHRRAAIQPPHPQTKAGTFRKMHDTIDTLLRLRPSHVSPPPFLPVPPHCKAPNALAPRRNFSV